jgi:predicted flap endonuclease-1-like 5' DNA nuclease
MSLNLNPWLALLLGILIGWVLEWLLELWFFRRRRLECQRRLADVEAQLRTRDEELRREKIRTRALEDQLAVSLTAAPVLVTVVEPPAVEVAVPEIEIAPPEMEIVAPEIKAELTEVEIAAPEVAAELPDVEIAAPLIAAELPEVAIAAPEIKAELPEVEVAAPVIKAELPEVEFAAPLIAAELPEVEIAAPEIKAELPEVEIAAPEIKAELPEVEIAAPDIKAELPEVEVAAPAVKAELLEVEFAAPVIKAELPEVELVAPVIKAELPEVGFAAPDIETELPEVEIAAPAVKAELPEVELVAPEIKAELPGIAVAAPAVGAALSGIAVAAPGVKAELPEVEIAAPTVKAELPEVEFAAHEIKAELPEVEIAAPAVKAELPEVELVAPEIKAELPGIAVAAPAVGAALSGIAVAAPGVKAELPEVEIAAAAIEAELPEIEIATPAVKAGLPAVEIAAPDVTPKGKAQDDLTVIRGIGPKFAAQLAAAGIASFAALAAATPDQLREAAKAPTWQQVDYDTWIAEAKTLGTQSRSAGDDLLIIEGIGPVYAAKLQAAGITTFAQVAAANDARLTEIIQAPAWRKVDYASWRDQARLAAAGAETDLQTLQDSLNAREGQGDDLALIYGVGDKTAAALKAGGITTFTALAAASPEELDGIIKQVGLRAGDYAAWSAQARRLAGKRSQGIINLVACPQDLGKVKGVGAVYETKLYEAGIGTFSELANTDEAELRRIFALKDFQRVDLAAIQADAQRLAEETQSVGRGWAGTPPDDFEPLQGIGPTFEGRLYDAGICTYQALADATVEQLAAICKAPAWRMPDYANWIAQAKELLAQQGR